MMSHAAIWDRFLELWAESNKPWAEPEKDTDDYRKSRAVDVFNCAGPVAGDLYGLNPDMTGWVTRTCWCSLSHGSS